MLLTKTRILAALVGAVLGATLLSTPAFAGSPHWVDDKAVATVDGDTVTVVFKEAGLGDEAQVHVVLSADAACVNPGGNHPRAANKESFNAAGDFPVQNGRAEGSLSLSAVFDPSCSPPMSVQWSNIVLTDETNGIAVTLG